MSDGTPSADGDRLLRALERAGWQWSGDTLYAPRRTMWLERDVGWSGDLSSMLDRMRGRRERIRRFAEEESNDDVRRSAQECIDDVTSVILVLERLCGAMPDDSY